MRDLMKPPLRIFTLRSALATVLLCGGPSPGAGASETNGAPADAGAGTNSSLLVLWGMPECTRGDAYTGPGPAWWRGGGKFNGEWTAEGWRAESETPGPADLVMFLDRARLSTDLNLIVRLETGAPADLRIGLLDDSFNEVVPDLAGNVALAASFEVLRIPLTAHSDATAIRLRRHSGALLVRSCLLTAADAVVADPSRDPSRSVNAQAETDAAAAPGGPTPATAPEATSVLDGATSTASQESRPFPSAPRTSPGVIHVDSDHGDDARDGLAAALGAGLRGPKRTIAAAIAAAADGDTIQAAGSAVLRETRWDLGNKRLTLRPIGTMRARMEAPR